MWRVDLRDYRGLHKSKVFSEIRANLTKLTPGPQPFIKPYVPFWTMIDYGQLFVVLQAGGLERDQLMQTDDIHAHFFCLLFSSGRIDINIQFGNELGEGLGEEKRIKKSFYDNFL